MDSLTQGKYDYKDATNRNSGSAAKPIKVTIKADLSNIPIQGLVKIIETCQRVSDATRINPDELPCKEADDIIETGIRYAVGVLESAALVELRKCAPQTNLHEMLWLEALAMDVLKNSDDDRLRQIVNLGSFKV